MKASAEISDVNYWLSAVSCSEVCQHVEKHKIKVAVQSRSEEVV